MTSSGSGTALRIGINAHLLSGSAGYRRAGIHNYMANVLNHLPLLDERLDYMIYTNNAHDLRDAFTEKVVPTSWPVSRRSGRILWEQLALPFLANRHGLALLHGMAFVTPLAARVPSVVTVYDLSFVHYPERFPLLQRLYLSSQTRRSCRHATRVMTISESGRKDVSRLYGVPVDKIDVVYPGVSSIFRPVPPEAVAAFRQKQGLDKPFVLHVGTLQPRKNVPTLLQAFALLHRPNLELVLVGGKGWFFDEIYEQVKHLGISDRVRFTGYVPDEDLPFWYNAASMLVFPSVHEGFGMPVAEAMACGLPIIAAQTSAIPEAAGEAALFFAPTETKDLAGHMGTLLDSPALAADLRARGLEQARRFTWQEAGKHLFQHYLRALDLV